MSAYTTLKFMIKYKRKSAEVILDYCDAYLSAGKITESEYYELVDLLEESYEQ